MDPDIGSHTFGNKGIILVSVAMYIEIYLVVTGFLILEENNLYNLFSYTRLEKTGIIIREK